MLGTSEKLDLGGFLPAANGELAHIRQDLFIRGTHAGSAALFLGLHLSTDFTAAFAVSNSIFILDMGSPLVGSPTGDFVAEVRFDFSRVNLNKNQEYRLSLQSTGYTRTGDTLYVSALRDFPNPTFEISSPNSNGAAYPARKQLFAFQEPN